MTMPMCEDGGTLREWAPLTTFLQQIPAKIQNGLFTHDISLTCIDVVPEFIAAGTNHGLIYWYDREKEDLQRLRCENVNGRITRVRIASTVDYMVAAGNEHGVVTVFQIPKSPPDSLPDSLKPKQKKQVERYTISGLHKSAVTAVEWSKNGMKLFSGDQEGLVVLTEIDFYMHLSKSSELLNEKYSVVQLSYHRGLLLVSTTLRTILVNRNENDKVIQVGQKERKYLAKLGATFANRQNLNPQDVVIYASRPGLRLWHADRSGAVSKTLIFKDALRPHQGKVQLLNPAPETAKKNRYDPTFGIVLPFSEELLLTYGDDVVYVVNPRNIAITSVIADARRVCDVACTSEEIFILEGERNIIRVAYSPETCDVARFAPESWTNASLLDPVMSLAEIGKPVAMGILELTNKFQESTVLPAIPLLKTEAAHGEIRSAPIVAKAEEATEVILSSGMNAPLLTDVNGILEFGESEDLTRNDARQNDRRMIFQKIGEQEFEDVVFSPQKRTDKLRKRCFTANDHAAAFSNCHPNDDSTPRNARTSTTHSSLLSLSTHHSLVEELLPNSQRNLETIRRDVESKEKLLADVLDFDLSKYGSNGVASCKDEPPNLEVSDGNNPLKDFVEEPSEEASKHEDTYPEESGEEDEEEDVSYRMELKKLEELGECRKQLLLDKLNESPAPGTTTRNDKQFDALEQLNPRELDFQKNASPKEWITTTMTKEEGWVFVKNIYA